MAEELQDYSEPLDNAQREKFAQLVSLGISPTAAYTQAGYKNTNNSSCNHSKTRRRDDVSGRIRHLQMEFHRALTERILYTKQDVIDGLWDTVALARGAKEMVDRQGKNTGQFAVDLKAAINAYNLLGMELGMFVKETRRREDRHLEDLPDDELAAAARAAAERLGKPSPDTARHENTGSSSKAVH